MVTIKYTGTGITSGGVKYSPTVNDGLYDVENEVGEYLTTTFPRDFSKISNKVSTTKKEVEKEVPKAEKVAPKKTTRRKKTTTPKED